MERAFSSLASRLRSSLNWEVGLYALLIIIALVMRLWDLGARAIHYDECVHVTCGLDIFEPLPWCLEAWTHGPFQFDGTALMFFLFGDSDFTARLLPVIFGTAIVALPYFLRRQLGRWGALAVAVLLAFSPLFLYYSRYARNDIYIVFFMLLLVVCLWRYFEERKARYLYIGAAALSLSFCTKEVGYITVAIIALFFLIIAGKELVTRVGRGFNLKELSAPAEYLILIGTLSLPLFGAFINAIPGIDLGQDFSNVWAKVLVIFLFAVGAAIGLRWDWRRWLISALIFWGIFILLYTTFFTNASGFATGIWGTVAYWVGEHETARGGQPEYYYLTLIPIYEFLPLLFAAIGAIYYTIKENFFSKLLLCGAALSVIFYAIWGGEEHLVFTLLVCGVALSLIIYASFRKGDLFSGFLVYGAGSIIILYTILHTTLGWEENLTARLLTLWAGLGMILYAYFGRASLFSRFLLYWAALSLILFSFFGEKMPWLSLHIALPVILLGGMFIGRLFQGFRWRWVKPRIALASIALVLLLLFSFSMHVAFQESYQKGDDPPQMLLYAGISSDVPRIVAQIDELARETGQEKELTITVDSSIYYSGWAWYLRDYAEADKVDHNIDQPSGSVLIVGLGNEPADESYLENYGEGERITMLIWFPEEYKKEHNSDFGPGWWWRYFLHRETLGPYWTTEGVVYFPKSTP